MRILKTLAGAAAASLAISLSAPAWAATEIQFWHAMGGALGEKVEQIAAGLQRRQDNYKVVPVYKGNYTETMTAAIAAFRAAQQPAIVQVFEVGTATMMAAKGAIKPVYEVMENADIDWDPNAYLPAVKSYYVSDDGKLLSLPFNSSTPVLWYNKDLLDKAGAEPPKTWDDVFAVADKLHKIDHKCALSIGWQSWTMIENYPRLAQQADRHRAERLWRPRHQADLRPVSRARRPAAAHRRQPEGGHLQVWRPARRLPAAVHHRRMRDVDQLVGLLRRHQEAGQVRVRRGDAAARHRDGARSRRTRSSAARRCGCWRASRRRL